MNPGLLVRVLIAVLTDENVAGGTVIRAVVVLVYPSYAWILPTGRTQYAMSNRRFVHFSLISGLRKRKSVREIECATETILQSSPAETYKVSLDYVAEERGKHTVYHSAQGLLDSGKALLGAGCVAVAISVLPVAVPVMSLEDPPGLL